MTEISRLAYDPADPVDGARLVVGPDDPTTVAGGVDLPIGSGYIKRTTGQWHTKFGPAATDWTALAASTGFLPLSGGSLNAGANLTVPGTLTATNGTFTNRPTVSGTGVMLVGESVAWTVITGKPTTITGFASDAVDLNRLGAQTTGGVLDWNDVTNARPGSGVTLLTGNAANGPLATSGFFHSFSLEYATKNGTGTMTQLAIPYGDDPSRGIWIRGRYSAVWGTWKRIAYTGDAITDAQLSANVALKASANIFTATQTIKKDSTALSLQANTASAAVFHQYLNSTGARRGYVGFGAVSSPAFYLNNDEGGFNYIAAGSNSHVWFAGATTLATLAASGLSVPTNITVPHITLSGNTNPYVQFSDGTYVAYVQMTGGSMQLYYNGSSRINVTAVGDITLTGAVTTSTTLTSGGSIVSGADVVINNGQSYYAKRATGGAAVTVFRYDSGTDDLSTILGGEYLRWRDTGTGVPMSLQATGILDVLLRYNLGGVTLATFTSSYNLLCRRDGGYGIYLGGADPTNYYDNDGHIFRTRASAQILNLTNAAINAYADVQVNSGDVKLMTSGKKFKNASGAAMAAVIFSSAAPSGTAEEGTLWIQY